MKKIRYFWWLKPTASDIRVIALLLAGAYAASLLARFHWFLDLSSHFVIQYVIGGIILTPLLLFFRRWKFAALIAAVTLLNAAELYRYADFSRAAEAKPALTMVQYNRNYGPQDQSGPRQWLTDNIQDFDFVVLQEANYAMQKTADELAPLYPHQIQQPRRHAFGMIILSKLPFLEQETIGIGNNFALRMVIQPEGMAEPLEIYALHAYPPVNKAATLQRNNEVLTVARRIHGSAAKNIVMIGDWNLTPYSPYFTDLVKLTGLKERFTLMPLTTWPAFAFPPLQIPIDHIMYKGGLTATSLKREPAMGSDHYPVIASFAASR